MPVPKALVTHLSNGVDPIDAAAIPLVSLTGGQLVRVATQAELVEKGGGGKIVLTI